MGYVYKITNTINNKAYIGISIHEPTQGRIKDHLSGRGNRLIAKAVKKYGKDAFTYEILEENVFDEFLPDLEVAYIANFNTIAPNGYNLNSGGDHAIPSVNTRRKMSEAKKGNQHLLGKTPSINTRRKISKANKGEKNHFYGKTHSVNARRKMSEAKKGATFSSEHLRKLSDAHKGEKNHNFGNPFASKHLRKLSESKRLPEYVPAHDFFLSLPPDMPLKEKRKSLYTSFPNVKDTTIRKWVRKWLKESN